MSVKEKPEFGRFRSFLWPIHRFELKKFLPLFIIYSLICFNYSLLRAAKDALVITAPSSGAEAIPFIKVWAILPMAILITVVFTKLFNRYSHEQVFYLMVGIFLGFFLLFSTVLYPYRDFLHPHGFADSLENMLPSGFHGLVAIIRNWTFTLFYVMSELWGTAIMTVLFWGVANEITSVGDAKRFYAILGVGANIATIFAGQISVITATSFIDLSFLFGSEKWGQVLGFITTLSIGSGVIIIGVFRWYVQNVLKSDVSFEKVLDKMKKKSINTKMGLRKSFSYLAKSKYLICIAIVVIAYNISLNMIEIVWKDQLKLLYPDPSDYNAYMGKILIATGILSTFIGLFLCGNLIRKVGWTISALVTPMIVLVTAVGFFSFMIFHDGKLAIMTSLLGTTPLVIGVFFGAMQNSFTRACKYTLFDATKEISFIPLSSESKLKGKAAIDGVGSRLGKSGGSLIHQVLLMVFGSISMSTPFVGILLIGVIGAWMVATKSLGKRFHKLSLENEKLDIDLPSTSESVSTQEAPDSQEALV